MANNNSISYWNSITNTYSDSLPNPDVVTASIFNDMNRGLMELKWRNSVQRTLTNSDIYTAYGSTVPVGSVLMHECVDITFLDMDGTSDQRKHIVRFHLIKGNDEQIVTYRSTYDPLVGTSIINVDWGSDMFPITVQTANQMGGAPNKLKIEMRATSNNAEEFSYWIETNAPVSTSFDANNTARSSSSNPSWSNLSNVIANTLGNNKGMFADVYTGNSYGYQRKYYKLADTTWRFQTSQNTVATASLNANQIMGSLFTVDNINTNSISTNAMTVIDTLNVIGDTYLNTVNIANITNDNIYVSNIYAKNGTSFSIADPVVIRDGAVIFGTVSHAGAYTLTGGLDASSIDVSGNIDIDGVVKSDDFSPHTSFSTMQMNGSVNVTGTLMYDRLRANSMTTWTSSQTPTSLSNGNYDLQGSITIDLRTCANTAGDLYIFQGRRATEEGSDPSIIYKYPYYASTTADRTISVGGGYYTILVGTGTTGVFNALKP